MKPNIAIIGCGVSGLMSGIRLLEKDFAVTIFSREHEPNMASRAAPAIWTPYKAFPEDKVLHWAEYALNVYKNLYENVSEEMGVTPIPLIEYHIENDLPLWTKILKEFSTLDKQLPEKCITGYSTITYLIDTSVFVDYLIAWYKKLNGKIQFANFNKIEEVNKQFDLIINCSGAWSQQLVPDQEAYPIRGQYILTEKVKGIDSITFAMQDENNYILIVPRSNDCYIGGTVDANDWNSHAVQNTTDSLLTNAKKLIPQLNDVPIKKVGVGFRPGRSSVRLEKALLSDGRTVIHNYGHGGSGFTIGWGCAAEVADLVQHFS